MLVKVVKLEEARKRNLLTVQKSMNCHPTCHAKLYNKLRAVEIEIDAVTSSVEQVKNLARNENHFTDGSDGREEGDEEDEQSAAQDSRNDLTLQHALATDRLRSLKKTKAQLVKEISKLSKNDHPDNYNDVKVIQDLVREETRPKSRLKEVQKSSKSSKKRQKIVAFDEDDDFDAVLNSASAGFIETERDELVRKGILTPFHKLKGFERRVEPSGPSKERTKVYQGKRKDHYLDKKWRKSSSHAGELSKESDVEGDVVTSGDEEDQENGEDVDGAELPFLTLEGGLKIPENVFSKLFDYQKVLSFLGALHVSNLYKPSIVICPVTLLRQWKREAHKWYPSFHVEILHDSAQDPTSKRKRAKSYDSDSESEAPLDSDSEGNLSSKNTKKWDSLINRVLRSHSGLLITTYEQLRLLGEKLVDIEWGYAVLDEGHRIRNPNAEVTLVCKQLQTVHRIIMTGAPIQNKLSELWSLFDFVFPGKLGVLPVFESEFAVPISVGGYANASPLQVSTAYRCAVVLRDLIMPYLLRRMKADVNAQLPKKTEHVLFCSLTPEQRQVYRAFLASSEVEQIFNGNRNSLYGIDVMRKICNHPDLLEREHSYRNPDYGNPERSGKMKVVAQVLKVWREQGHRVLLFAQTQQMLDILENFLNADGYSYRRMDGMTPVKQRMPLIDEFNNSDDVFIFILTTKVGGLGTNLTGANRVIIFDPDWNPSTDMQARERAWRIGQTKDVTVYRLITRGTIEEKSAMNHDVIMNAHDEEKIRLEEQASQVAQKAAEALRPVANASKPGKHICPNLDRKIGCCSSGATVPNGFAVGASAGKALSSAELLARIRGNQERAVGDGIEHQFGLASSPISREKDLRIIGLLSHPRNYPWDRVPSKDLPLFKNLLKEIATLERDSNGSSWVLKPEYQQH
ncbi:chromatin remodeling 8 [Actinidia rufa]|uniref:Chromatin remodeling 8 n=1 Tax=Actinidia rufa TaxID=165716 RepID=A0A7J0H3T2_9ERIC|nr:chromatin remodeling 8 [Actinidia rufa]